MRLLLVVGSALCLVSCRPTPDTGHAILGSLRIQGAYAFQPVTRDEAAAYFEVANSGDTPDTLIAAGCEIAHSAMIHGMAEGAAGGMADMGRLPIPAHDGVRLEPGRLHLMLTDLERIPQAGEHLNLTLTFARAGTIALAVPVRPYGR